MNSSTELKNNYIDKDKQKQCCITCFINLEEFLLEDIFIHKKCNHKICKNCYNELDLSENWDCWKCS